jgi:hypothetical protein
LLCNRLIVGDRRMAPALCGALAPDVIDKTLAWVLRITDSSHSVAHSAAAGVALSVAARAVFGADGARSFASAYVLHLVEDEWHHGRVRWLFPLSHATRRPKGAARSGWPLALEIPAAVVLLALLRARK